MQCSIRLLFSGSPNFFAIIVEPKPAVWHCRGDVLCVAEKVRGPGSDRSTRAASVARGERTAEEAGGGSDVGQAHPDGGCAKKALKPTRRRELATWIYEGFKLLKARACRLALLSLSTFYRKRRAPQQLEPRRRIREIAMARPRFGYQRIHILLRREGWQVKQVSQVGFTHRCGARNVNGKSFVLCRGL